MRHHLTRIHIGLRTVKTTAAVIISMALVHFYGTTDSKYIFAMLGAMAGYVSRGGVGDFVPMNANFGILKELGFRVKGGKVAKYEKLAERSLAEVERLLKE